MGRRWLRQLQGGHLASETLNEISIGICLVGDFSRNRLGPRQTASLIELVQYLRKLMPETHLKFRLHREINTRPTECPGRLFPGTALHEIPRQPATGWNPTQIFRDLGPSNSAKYTVCQVPNLNFPFSIGHAKWFPNIAALRCAAELPSAWRYSRLSHGTARSSAAARSRRTSGSAPSWIVTAAVVCGMKTCRSPSRQPRRAAASSSSCVIGTNSVWLRVPMTISSQGPAI